MNHDQLAETDEQKALSSVEGVQEHGVHFAGAYYQFNETDWRNALALINHLDRCHRAALEVPGIGSALTKHPLHLASMARSAMPAFTMITHSCL